MPCRATFAAFLIYPANAFLVIRQVEFVGGYQNRCAAISQAASICVPRSQDQPPTSRIIGNWYPGQKVKFPVNGMVGRRTLEVVECGQGGIS